jgi:hypothetical protein
LFFNILLLFISCALFLLLLPEFCPVTFPSAAESMSDLLQGRYTDFTNDDTDYPFCASIKKAGHLNDPKPTIASQAGMIARQQAEEKVSCYSHSLFSVFSALCYLSSPLYTTLYLES